MKLSKSIAGLALAGSMVLGATAALADGLPRYGSIKDAPYVAPFSWTGLYAGVHAGYHWSGSDAVSVAPANAVTAAFWNPSIIAGAQPTSISPSRDGFIGGAQLGYNLQSGTLVWGAEADISWLDVGETRTVSNGGVGIFVPNTSSASSDTKWLGTVRARLGFLMSPQLLAYVTGGFAYGDVSHSFQGNFNATNDHFAGGSSKTETGWTVGGGLEWAMDRNWILRGEYLYYDLGSSSFSTVGTGNSAGRGTFSGSADNTGHIARVGINYKF